MPATTAENPARARARRADERRIRLGLSRAEVARRLGRVTPSEHAVLAQLLRGEFTSEPLVSDVERALDEVERSAAALAP